MLNKRKWQSRSIRKLMFFNWLCSYELESILLLARLTETKSPEMKHIFTPRDIDKICLKRKEEETRTRQSSTDPRSEMMRRGIRSQRCQGKK